MMLVQASERRNSAGKPSLLAVRISSTPFEDALRLAVGVTSLTGT
jgi:hypothetical protein